ncbi:DUF2391 domain-containing protein [Halopenitus persicus]|uniref:Integral membrane protein n=1 Tax=Halopenitus persicus TaxID=1048396 RepID=A0A1H3N4A9_9EURY|nr:DUF2391 domain-containing protein [Halopenitus persicus]SDY83676.1 hypothetical protein SAMN05216564_11159 [Halopenitus persicus]
MAADGGIDEKGSDSDRDGSGGARDGSDGDRGGPSDDGGGSNDDEEHPDIEDLLDRLDDLSDAVDEPHERQEVERTISLVRRMPGSTAFTEHIYKYTSRDMAEALVGSVIFALPFLVEDGVFVIARWFTAVRVGPVPVAFLAHVLFVLGLTGGLLYYADIREVRVTRPVFGLVPRRYLGVLLVSFGAAFGMLALWGRLVLEDPTPFEAFARVTVVWAPAALGAALGDILPGESKGEDISELFDDD